MLRIIQKLFHQTIFHGIIDIQSAFNSVRFLAIPRAKAVCLDILNFFRPEFLSLLLLSMTIIFSILFSFRRKNWKNTLLTGRFLITESRRHKNNILSGQALISLDGGVYHAYICLVIVYQPVENNNKKNGKRNQWTLTYSHHKSTPQFCYKTMLISKPIVIKEIFGW